MSASPPSKKRTSRACVYCKSRKQKCGGYTAEIKCSACQQRKIRCSFEDEAEDPRYNPYLRYEQAAARQNAMYNGNGDEPSGTGSSAIGPFRTGSRPSIGDSNGGHNGHRDSWQHIAPQAEAGPSRQHSTAGLPLNPPQSIAMAGRVSSARNDHLSSPHSQSPPIRSPLPSDFRGPLRTLQHLVSDDLKSVEDVDPIRRHVITPGEASMLFQIFFKNCHAHAPFLDVQANSDWKKCQDSSSLLFLGILQVAARYWGHSSRADSWLHPRYNELVALLDMEVTRLTLRPRDGDASLATLQGLMLYAHWMPLEVAPHGQVRFRFSETGAWQALGLAIRWATQLDLDSVADFSAETGNVQEFRTVAYLTESDHYVSLSTRRRPTLDTQGLAIGCSAFLASGRTQSTDLRLVSLLRVAHASSIILRGVVSGSVSVESVKAFNEDVIQVERDYIETASRQGGGVDSHARQFPYTSLRWYRLAFASVLLNSASPWSAIGEMFHWAVNWASQILFFLSGSANRGERNLTDDTGEPLLPDPSLVHFLTFAIDHYYVVVAYSAAFLVVAWRQGAIDDHLETCPQTPNQLTRSTAISQSSLLYRLVDLAANTLFACASKSQHLAIRYAHFIRGLADTLLQEPPEQDTDGQPASSTNPIEASDWDISYLWQQAGLDPGFLSLSAADMVDIHNSQDIFHSNPGYRQGGGGGVQGDMWTPPVDLSYAYPSQGM